MPSFPPDFLDQIRERVALEDVIGRRVKLVRRGREYVGLSPFQKEKTPSFTVVPEKGFYKCFSSGESGDIFDFLMKVDGLSFPRRSSVWPVRRAWNCPPPRPRTRAPKPAAKHCATPRKPPAPSSSMCCTCPRARPEWTI